ncbi:MAG: hypothetical protein JNJ88_08670 [Planctomycetes bacterium]|nr:hypothetical protein [Planctomycetota bacterium]
MSDARSSLVLAGVALLAGGSLGALVAWVAPRAHAAGLKEATVRTDAERIRAGIREKSQVAQGFAAGGVGLREELQKAAHAQQIARSVAQSLLSREPLLGGGTAADRARLVEDLTQETGKSRPTIEALLPQGALDPEESAFRLTTIRDLSRAAIAAGAIDMVFFRFPVEEDPEDAVRYGRWLPTRLVRFEYEAGYEGHRSFLLGLLRRRDRGPFYVLEEVLVRPATPSLRDPIVTAKSAADLDQSVVATVTLRRIRPTPGESR